MVMDLEMLDILLKTEDFITNHFKRALPILSAFRVTF